MVACTCCVPIECNEHNTYWGITGACFGFGFGLPLGLGTCLQSRAEQSMGWDGLGWDGMRGGKMGWDVKSEL